MLEVVKKPYIGFNLFMPTVFWEIIKYHKNEVIIRFWKKPSKSDAIIISIRKSSDSEILKAKIEQITGLKHYILVYAMENDEGN